jgi:hypothetical protein
MINRKEKVNNSKGKQKPYDGSKALNNVRQERFCLLYATCLNGKQSAIEAGYKKRSAEQQASRLLSEDKVGKRTKYLIEKKKDEFRASEQYVLQRLTTFAQSSNAHIAMKALELLGKHFAMFTTKVKVEKPRRIIIRSEDGNKIEELNGEQQED